MSLFSDNPLTPPELNPGSQTSEGDVSAASSAEPPAPRLGGDPLSYVVVSPAATAPSPTLPEDLRISWSWAHLICFGLFALVVQAVVPIIVAIPYLQGKHVQPEKLQSYLFSIPQFVVGSTLAVFGLVFLFLYVTLSALPGKPFWHTLGWRKLIPTASKLPSRPWLYFFSGAGLSLLAAIVGSRVHTPDDMPIELLMKSRIGAMFMMGMAVAVAPLVEETVFRGYLYPVIVRIASAILRFLGMDSAQALRSGIASSILVTGVSFGLLHGFQLAWTWGIVSVLILVGITFTYVRARTGTVFASYLMHLGYNSLIALAAVAPHPRLR